MPDVLQLLLAGDPLATWQWVLVGVALFGALLACVWMAAQPESTYSRDDD